MELDQAFKEKKINPGTSADLTVATVLAALLDDLFDNSVCQKV
jgi:triphosphoribosyl-dephospho-CoA synthase